MTKFDYLLHIGGAVVLILLVVFTNVVHASTLNPCEYMNINASIANKLDVGQDENFERIKQQHNREMITACQEYEIKLLNNAKNDINRDNY